MFVLAALFSLFTVYAADFPECEQLFAPVEELISTTAPDVDAAKKSLFKIANDKRIEVLKHVRVEKEAFRKIKDSEFNAFDVESKKNKATSSDERTTRRKEREVLSKKISSEKKEFNKSLDEKQKTCNTFLNLKRTEYLAKFRDIKNAPRATNHNKDIDGAKAALESLTDESLPNAHKKPNTNEFDEIPKGAGTVLKPQ